VSLSSHRSGDGAEPQGADSSHPLSDADLAQIERNLALSPSERLDQLVRTVAFIHAGRAALARRDE
jgi:hypothetical protein